MKKHVNKFSYATLLCVMMMLCNIKVTAQTTTKKTTVQASVVDGIIATGYVDNGSYINFTGPNIKWVKKPFAVLLGVLPSLRIKKDNVPEGAPKNSVITPTLGVGVTFAYKHLVLQVPVYYNAKTASVDGKWNVGVGIGIRF